MLTKFSVKTYEAINYILIIYPFFTAGSYIQGCVWAAEIYSYNYRSTDFCGLIVFNQVKLKLEWFDCFLEYADECRHPDLADGRI